MYFTAAGSDCSLFFISSLPTKAIRAAQSCGKQLRRTALPKAFRPSGPRESSCFLPQLHT